MEEFILICKWWIYVQLITLGMTQLEKTSGPLYIMIFQKDLWLHGKHQTQCRILVHKHHKYSFSEFAEELWGRLLQHECNIYWHKAYIQPISHLRIYGWCRVWFIGHLGSPLMKPYMKLEWQFKRPN
jgi:hypothetical protein